MNLNKLEDRIPELLRVVRFTMRDKCSLVSPDYVVCPLTDKVSVTIMKDNLNYYKITLLYNAQVVDSCLSRDPMCEEIIDNLGPSYSDRDEAMTTLDKILEEKDPWK